MRIFKQVWTKDPYPNYAQTYTAIGDDGKPGAKYFRELLLEADTQGNTVPLRIYGDGTLITTVSVNLTGRSETPFGVTPFIANEIQLVPQGAMRIFAQHWTKDDYPNLAATYTAIANQGKPGAKYVRQLLLEADTGGATVSVAIWADGALQQTISVTLLGRSEAPFSMNTPFVANEIQLIPAGEIRIFKQNWIFDEYPDIAPTYTEISDEGKPGAKYFRQLLLEGDTGGLNVTLAVWADGVFSQNLTINLTGRSEFPYPVTPFVANEIQLIPSGPTRIFKQVWTKDDYPDYAATTSEWDNAGVVGAKYVYGVIIEADTQNNSITVAVQSDAEIGSASFNLTVQHNGRIEKPYAFSPIVAHLLRFVPSGPWSLFRMKWIFDPWPENAALIPDFNDDSHPGEKFYQGLVLTADTGNSPVSVAVVTDDGVTQTTLTVQHNGKQEKPYSFTPFVEHQLHLVPAAAMRFFSAKWVWEPSPELTANWVTQLTSLGQRGFFHQRDCYIALQSTATVTLLMTFDLGNGTTGTASYTIASTGGFFLKQYLVLQAVKGKLVSFSLTSTAPFRLFAKDCEMRVKPWGSNEPYAVVKPFGGPSIEVGAAI
jgi:hypothetical protein